MSATRQGAWERWKGVSLGWEEELLILWTRGPLNSPGPRVSTPGPHHPFYRPELCCLRCLRNTQNNQPQIFFTKIKILEKCRNCPCHIFLQPQNTLKLLNPSFRKIIVRQTTPSFVFLHKKYGKIFLPRMDTTGIKIASAVAVPHNLVWKSGSYLCSPSRSHFALPIL